MRNRLRKNHYITKNQILDFIQANMPAFSSEVAFKRGIENVIKELIEYPNDNVNQLRFYNKVLINL